MLDLTVEILIKDAHGRHDFFGTKNVDPRLLEKANLKDSVKGSGLDGMRSIVYKFDPEAVELLSEEKVTWNLSVSRMSKLKLMAVLRPFKGSFKRHSGLELVIR